MKKNLLSRRQFLGRMGTLGGWGALYYGMANFGLPSLVQAYTGPPQFDRHSGTGQHIVILGAGIGGLCAAYLLRKSSFKITIIEPNPYVGGRCLTIRRGDRVKEHGTDHRGRPFRPQNCEFDEGTDFYFNAGPGRIPQSHTAILHYCKELKVKLQPYIFACRSNLLQSDDFNQGKPVRLRWIKHDLRGHIAELLSHAAASEPIDHLIGPGRREALLRMLRHYGSLKESGHSLKYLGTSRGGYREKPGAGLRSGVLRRPFDLYDILDSEIWQTGLFSDMYLYWQTSLMQAEGGMDHIPKAFRDRLGPQTQVMLNAKATGISQTADKIIITHTKSDTPIKADYCISTMAPSILHRLLDGSFQPNFRTALANIYMVPACKVGWQSKSRFWEEQNEIYGGISWTRHDIKQLWYPSHGFHASKGILTGTYNYGAVANKFGLMSHAERLAVALEGGEKLHPDLFKRNVEKGISLAWQNMPNQSGGWAYYKDQADNPTYLSINQPQGRLVLAGDYLSFLSGWMEGAVRSAELAVNRITQMVAA